MFFGLFRFRLFSYVPECREKNNEDEFGISTSDGSEDEQKKDFTEADPFNGVSIEYLVRTISEEANRALKNGKDEATMSDDSVYSFGSRESNEDENNQNELNDKESTKNYFKARTPKISEFVLNGQSKSDVYSDAEVLPLGSEEENE